MMAPPARAADLARDLLTLLYLDTHRGLNRPRVLLRDPKRLLGWTFLLLLMVAVFVPARLAPAVPGPTLVTPDVLEWPARLAPGLFLLVAGVTIWGSRRAAPGGDCYPELWSSSSRMFVLRRQLRTGRFFPGQVRRALREAGMEPTGERRLEIQSAPGRRVPPGAWVLLWKEWLTLSRLPGGLLLSAGVVLLALAAGAVTGYLWRHGHAVLAESGGVLVGALFVSFNLATAVRLAPDLRNPLWWLSASPLRARLLVWSVASGLRQFAALAAAVIGAAVAAASPVWLTAIPVLLVVLWDLRTVALGSYALLPAPMDVRGPASCCACLPSRRSSFRR